MQNVVKLFMHYWPHLLVAFSGVATILKAIYKDLYWFLRIRGLFKSPKIPDRFFERRKRRSTPQGIATMSLQRVQTWSDLADEMGNTYGVDSLLIQAIIWQESGGVPTAVNNTGGDALRGGSYGLMQMSLKTAKGYGYNGDGKGLLDPRTNIDIGTRYLRDCLAQSNGDINGAAQAYNSGRTTGAPRYADAVVGFYKTLGGVYGDDGNTSPPGATEAGLGGSVPAPVLIALGILAVLAAIVTAVRGGLH